MFAIVSDLYPHACVCFDGMHEGFDATYALAFTGCFRFSAANPGEEVTAVRGGMLNLVVQQDQLPFRFQIGAIEDIEDLARHEFLAAIVSHALYKLAHLDSQLLGNTIAEGMLQDEAHAAFARLAVDADDWFIGPPDICGIYRQIRYLPDRRVFVRAQRQSLGNSVLMRSREGRKHQLASVGLARRHRHLRAILESFNDGWQVREIQAWQHPLRIEVHRQRDHIGVAGTFAIAKQGSLHALCARQHGQLRGSNRTAAIVVGVHAQYDITPSRNMRSHPFNLVGIHIGR